MRSTGRVERSRPSRRDWLRHVGTALVVIGLVLLAWYGYEHWARHRAQRQALERLAALEMERGRTEAPVDLPAGELAFPSAPPPMPGEPVARIVVPAGGVDAVAFEGIDAAVLDRGAGHFPGTALPGEKGNTAFAAHRDSFFRGLREVEIGDEVLLETPRDTLRYRVTDTRVVEPNQVEVVASRGVEEVTLVTCYPFDFIGPAPRRFVVHATREGRLAESDRLPSRAR